MSRTKTKGGVDPENLKLGDILYEYEHGIGIESKVISEPVKSYNNEGKEVWEWKSKAVLSGRIINYLVTEGYSFYGPNVYDYPAYSGVKMI